MVNEWNSIIEAVVQSQNKTMLKHNKHFEQI